MFVIVVKMSLMYFKIIVIILFCLGYVMYREVVIVFVNYNDIKVMMMCFGVINFRYCR